MNKQARTATVRLADKQVVLLGNTIVTALLGRALDGHTAAPAAEVTTLSALPRIGADWNGGIYAGLSVADEAPVALVLLPGDEKLPWDAARTWAEKQGGVLPSRFDQFVLFKNLKDKFKPEWYWSGEPYAGNESYAWVQGFSSGNEGHDHKDDLCRARAVRRLIIK